MTNFAQALARIGELQEKVNLRHNRYNSLQDINELITLLRLHADSIVQLGKVSQEMREQHTLHYFDNDPTKPWAAPSIHGSTFKLGKAVQEFDKLMKGE